MRLGILPAVGSGLASMKKTGQLGRLWRHLQGYADGGYALRYFSYLTYDEEEPIFAHRPDWRAPHHIRYRSTSPKGAVLRPLAEASVWRDLSVCRAMNLLGAIPAITARLVFGTPFVVSHGADYEAIAALHGRSSQHQRKWAVLRRLVFSLASTVLVPRRDMALAFQRRYPRAKIHWQPNWVDCERFSPNGQPDLGHLLYVGRLVKEKNLERLARVARVTGRPLYCVGEGPLQAELQRLGAICPGPSEWEYLPDIYRSATVFVLPSLTEGHPKALLEAMACGVPVAVSDRVGEVRHEETGLVFGAEDETSMAQQIRRLLNEPDLATHMAQRGRTYVAEQYDVNRLMPRELEILEKVR